MRVVNTRRGPMAQAGGCGKQIPGRLAQKPERQVPHSQSLLVLHFLISHPESGEVAMHSLFVGHTTPPDWEQWITEQPCGSTEAAPPAPQM